MRFRVIDNKTGKEADTYEIALHEEWAQGLVYCDMEGFAITEDGDLVLMDECGTCVYCDPERFKVVFEDERPQWIPCSERSPDGDGRYIVTEKRFSIDDRKHNGWYQTIVEEVVFSSGKWDRAKFFEIVAWMPLPKPYKREGEENE